MMKLSPMVYLTILVSVECAIDATEDCAVRFEDNDVCVCSTHDPNSPVKCHNSSQTIEVLPCHCVYYDQQLNKTVVGRCFYTCYQSSRTYIEVTSSSEFNDNFCDSQRQGGFFCYQCKENYSLAVFSRTSIDCVPCQYYGYKNWLKTLSFALLPLTLFYILAVLLGLNITSSSFSGLILVLQCIRSSPLRTYVYLYADPANPEDHYGYNLFIRVFFGLLEIVNLNFFKTVYSAVCLHPKLSVFGVMSLNFIIALYPFLLIFITYLLVGAYGKQYKLLVWMWKPFKVCTDHYRKTWNNRTSLMEIFATFILLSSVKILQVSFRLLSYIATYDVAGNKLHNIVSLSANVKYLSSHHLPYALLAIIISFIFVALPLILLAIYPCRCFHRCLNACGLRLQTLHVFMDAFQGSYKTHPHDMRYFSAFYMILRVVLLALITPSIQSLYAAGMISLASAAVVVLFRPYKVNAHNIIDSVLLLLMGTYFISCNQATLMASLSYNNDQILSSVLQGLSILLIFLYFVVLVIWKLLHKQIRVMMMNAKDKWNSIRSHRESGESDDLTKSFVDDRELAATPLLSQQ